MASSGRPAGLERRRDNQQWMLDWMVKTTGRTMNFAYDGRWVPPEVKSHRMIPRVMEKIARHQERIAHEAERRGHYETAGELFFRASQTYQEAQHAIFEDDNPEKIYLHGKLIECYQGVMRHAPYPMELVEIPFEGTTFQAVFHTHPSRRRGPAILHVPGMDRTKESFLSPFNHPLVRRGFHVLAIDGPGQGTSNIRKLRITLDNYERAGKAAIDWLVKRPEVDPERIGVHGFSMGSYWTMQIAAVDPRVKAVAATGACYGSKRAIFEEASPRFKQVYMYMAGIHDEDEFDRMAEQMDLRPYAERVGGYALMINGEYDQLSHLEEAYEVWQRIPGPKEFWVTENDFHGSRGNDHFGGLDYYDVLADWLRDAIAGKLPRDLKRQVLVRQKEGLGPYEAEISSFWLPGRIQG